MKIIECQIDNFGKLHDVIYNFNEGLNVICEKNGAGKSTLAIFIKTMFYGFANENKRKDKDNERKKFMPWQGGVYGGQIIFSMGDKEYLLVRTFGSKEKEDATKLYDRKTMRLVEGYSSNIGEEIFKIDQHSFIKTIFVSQSDCDTEQTDSINAKLSNIVDDIANVDNYETGLDKLKDAINSLSPDRKTGEIYKLKNHIAECEDNIRQEEQLKKDIGANGVVLDESKGRLLELYERKNILEQQQKDEIIKAQNEKKADSEYKDICRQYEELKVKYQRELIFWGNEVISEDDMSVCYETVVRLQGVKKELGIKNDNESETVVDSIIRTSGIKSIFNNIGAIIFALIAVVLFFFNVYIAIVPIVIAALMFMHGRTERMRLLNYSKEYRKLKASTDKFFNKYKFVTADETSRMKELQEHYTLFNEIKRQYNEVIDIKSEYESNIEAISSSNLTKAYKEKNAGKNDNNGEFDEVIWITEQLNECSRSIVDYNSKISSIEVTLGRLKEQLANIEDIKAECDNLKARLSRQEYNYQILCKTRDYLIEAKANFTSKYINPVNNYFKDYFNLLSNSSRKEYTIDTNLNVLVKEKGMWREIDFFSSGQRSLIGICMRMAMVDAMYKEEQPFIIFDDPFIYFDDDRINLAMRLLRNISAQKQVIYFTCHESRVTLN